MKTDYMNGASGRESGVARESSTREGLINDLSRSCWLRLNGLMDAMMMKASTDLFEEIRNVTANTRLSRNFNSMRGLIVCRQMLVEDFREQVDKGWQRLADRKVVQPLVAYDEMANNAIRYYTMLARHNNPNIIRELDRMMRIISGKRNELYPLGPEFLLKAFWNSSRLIGINIQERLIVLRMFNRFVIEDCALVWNRALELLIVNEWLGGEIERY